MWTLVGCHKKLFLCRLCGKEEFCGGKSAYFGLCPSLPLLPPQLNTVNVKVDG